MRNAAVETSITNNSNNVRVEKLSHNIVPAHIRAVSKVENWVLKNFYNLDPNTERIIEFYTYNDSDGVEFDFKCPNYKYDLVNCMYGDFVEACHNIGASLLNIYGIPGRYYYEVKVTLKYTEVNGNWNMSYVWEVLETDNPRCGLGKPYDRRDCSYLENTDSKLSIDGYDLSGNYKCLSEVLTSINNKTILVHSTQDAKSLLRVMRFLGVKVVMIDGDSKSNIPTSRAVFNKDTFGYKLKFVDGVPVVYIVGKSEILLTPPSNLMDIDEFIVGKSVQASMRYM